MVQQKQGIVHATRFFRGKPINDDIQTEKRAEYVLTRPATQLSAGTQDVIQCQRSPTFFTYLATPSRLELPSCRQGPHTIPHVYYDVMIQRLSAQEIWDMIPFPAAIEGIIRAESVAFDADWMEGLLNRRRQSAGAGPYDAATLTRHIAEARTDFDKRIDRYLQDYDALYSKCDTIFASYTSISRLKPFKRKHRAAMLTLLNMHPYATYGWRGKYPSHTELKGKGEGFLSRLKSPSAYMAPTKILEYVDKGKGRTPFQHIPFKDFLFCRLQYAVRDKSALISKISKI